MVVMESTVSNDLTIGRLRVWVDENGNLHASVGNKEFGREEWDPMWSPTAGSHEKPSFVETVMFEGKKAFQQFWCTREDGQPPVISYQIPSLSESGQRGASCGRVIFHGWHGDSERSGFEQTEGVFIPDFNVGMIAVIIAMMIAVAIAGYRSVV